MILLVCTDDPDLGEIAQLSAGSNPGVFGNYYQVFTPLPQIGVNENLFIIAHGAFQGDDNNPVIGDENSAFYVNAVDLYNNLNGVFPVGYRGNVYIDACESANNNASTFSFAEVFLTQIQANFGRTQVYGRNGDVRGRIPLPDSPGWTQAH